MKAIVYTSKTGHTAEYANLLGEKFSLPVFPLKDALANLDSDTPIIYLGWIFANHIKGYKKANKKFKISAICAVGLCDTGTSVEVTRQKNSVPSATPLFTMQGGIDKTKLSGINKMMINMLKKGLSSKSDRSEDEERMLYLLSNDNNYVSDENTKEFSEWYNKQIKNTL